jgi:hypothetical protein
MADTLRVVDFSRFRRQLSYAATVGDSRFTTSLWYDTVDFYDLEARYGPDVMRRIYFHIVAFDVNKLISLKPGAVDFGPLADQATDAFLALWSRIFEGVWAQWRYENDLPDYRGPALPAPEPDPTGPARLVSESDSPRSLAFCGGGKDSLVAMTVLEETGEAFDTLAYSHSIYGSHARQHALIGALVDTSPVRARHRIWIHDDFLTTMPVLALRPEPGVSTITAAETPASAFASLPIAMMHGHRHLILAHEKSADRGNLRWARTGEEVNHQWGKSLEAERLLADYIRRRLVEDVAYFSILKPVHDPVIFSILRARPGAVRHTHSCNLEKPWCRRCAKCAYVWLHYCAWLPEDLVGSIFGENLFDAPGNAIWFRQLLGLEAHTPFECVGQAEESRLGFELARASGWRGRAMTMFSDQRPDRLASEDIERLFRVDREQHLLPAELHEVLEPLERHARSAREEVRVRLGR